MVVVDFKEREGARFVTSILIPTFSKVRRLLGKCRRILLGWTGRTASSGALCTQEQARIMLTLIYARPFSNKACQEQVIYPARSVLLYALASVEHIQGVMPDFVHCSGANTRAASLSFTGKNVQMVIDVLLGVESDDKGNEDHEILSWARAYEQFWTRILASEPSGNQLITLMGTEADSALSELRLAIRGSTEIDECVAGGRLEEAFVLAKRYVGRGFGSAASRYAALAFVHSASVYDLDQLVSQLGDRLPPGFAPKLWSVMQDRSVSVNPYTLKDLLEALSGLREYLPSTYTSLRSSPETYVGGSVRAKTLWALLSRERLRLDPLLKRTAIVVALSDGGLDQRAGETCRAITHVCDARSIRSSIRSIGSDSEPRAPVLLLREDPDAAEVLLPYLSYFFEEDEVLPVLMHTTVCPPSADWLVGDWTVESKLVGILAGSVARAHVLESELDDPFLERLVECCKEPLGIYRAAKPTDRGQPSKPEALIVSQSGASGRHRLEIAHDMSCDEALVALKEIAEREALDEELPVVVVSPALVYPSGYVDFMVQSYERRGRRTAVVLCDVVIDKDSRVRITGINVRRPVVQTSLIVLSCMSISDILRSLTLQPGKRFYEALALPSLPATAVYFRLDIFDDNQVVLAGIERLLEGDNAAACIHERFRRPLMGWISDDAAHLIPTVRGYDLAAQQYWGARTGMARFIQEPIDKKLSDEARFGVTSGWLDLMLDEQAVDLVEDFLQKAMSERAFLEGCSEKDFALLSDIARRLGQQAHYAELVFPHIISLCVNQPHLIVESFNFLVGAVDEAQFFSLLIAAGSVCFNQQTGNGRSMHRLIDIASRYANPQSLGVFLEVVAHSPNATVLFEPGVRSKLAGVLFSVDQPPQEFVLARISSADLKKAAPVEARIVAALNSGTDDSELAALLCRFTEENGDLVQLAEVIRPYSGELAARSITASEWPYFLHGDADTVLMIASILSDKVQIARSLLLARNRELIAMAGPHCGDWNSFDKYFESFASALGVTPMRFGGETVDDLFRYLAAQLSKRARTSMGGMVSVIMTAFNPDISLLRQALRSVLHQSHQSFELLLFDDGSEAEIGRQIAAEVRVDKRIRYIRSDRNLGPYLGRNLALEQASGEYIAIQDSDDFSHPDRFAVQIEQFVAHPNLMVCATRHLRFDLNGRPQLEHDFQLRGDGTMSSMFRKSVFDLIGPFAPVRSRGDVEFRERAKKALGPQAYRQLECPLVFCFSGPATLSHSTRRNKREQLQAFRRAFNAREWQWTREGPRPLGELAVPWALRP